jgi:hypothetical protein
LKPLVLVAHTGMKGTCRSRPADKEKMQLAPSHSTGGQCVLVNVVTGLDAIHVLYTTCSI